MNQQQAEQAPRYRAYALDENDRIFSSHDVPAGDDQEAIEWARSRVDGHALELWDGSRKVSRIEPNGR